jgi:hypothetical protein
MRNLIIVLLVVLSGCKKAATVAPIPILQPVKHYKTAKGSQITMTNTYIIETPLGHYDSLAYGVRFSNDTIYMKTVPYENRLSRFQLYCFMLIEKGGTFTYKGDTMIIIDWQKTDTIKLF